MTETEEGRLFYKEKDNIIVFGNTFSGVFYEVKLSKKDLERMLEVLKEEGKQWATIKTFT